MRAGPAEPPPPPPPPPPPGTRPAARARPVLLWTGVALLALAADAATKAWALSALRAGHQITVAGGLIRLRLVANHGAAFGFGAGYEPLVVLASAVGVVLLGLWVRYATSAVERFGAALAVGGGRATSPTASPARPASWHGAGGRLDSRLLLRPDVQPGRRLAPRRHPAAGPAWLWNRRNRPTQPVRP